MADEERGIEALVRELEELGPLMSNQNELERNGPDPAFATALRERLVGSHPGKTVARGPRRLWIVGGGAVAAAALAAVLALVFLRSPAQTGPKTPTALWIPPTPTSHEITKGYPFTEQLGGGGPIPATRSVFEVPDSAPYPGHLILSSSPLPQSAGTLPAYRIAGPSFDSSRMPAIARALGIAAPVRRVSAPDLTDRTTSEWLVAQTGKPGSQLPAPQELHSVAVEIKSGTLIYHDYRAIPNGAPVYPLSRAQYVARARAWLARIGWPADAMPVRPSGLPGESGPQPPASVYLGWNVSYKTDKPAALIQLEPNGTVEDALLSPPVDSSRSVPVGSVMSAFRELQRNRGPVGIYHFIMGEPSPDGGGIVTRTTVIEILARGGDGQQYLVPAYGFIGSASISNQPLYRKWYAAASAQR